MNLVWAVLIIAATTAVAVTVMLLVRRGAPEGSRFRDGDRASGVFGVLATGFSVLLGFIVFLAFASYDQSRSGAEDGGARAGPAGRDGGAHRRARCRSPRRPADLLRPLGGAHRVAPRYGGNAWATRSTHGASSSSTPFRRAQLSTPAREAAYGKWLDQTSDREGARNDRIHGAVGVIPTPLWVVLFFISIVIFVFMLFFADSGEGAVTQAVLMGSVASVIVAMLLLIRFLDSPFHEGVGGVKPVAMERTLRIIDESLRAAGVRVSPPCDEQGAPAS